LGRGKKRGGGLSFSASKFVRFCSPPSIERGRCSPKGGPASPFFCSGLILVPGRAKRGGGYCLHCRPEAPHNLWGASPPGRFSFFFWGGVAMKVFVSPESFPGAPPRDFPGGAGREQAIKSVIFFNSLPGGGGGGPWFFFQKFHPRGVGRPIPVFLSREPGATGSCWFGAPRNYPPFQIQGGVKKERIGGWAGGGPGKKKKKKNPQPGGKKIIVIRNSGDGRVKLLPAGPPIVSGGSLARVGGGFAGGHPGPRNSPSQTTPANLKNRPRLNPRRGIGFPRPPPAVDWEKHHRRGPRQKNPPRWGGGGGGEKGRAEKMGIPSSFFFVTPFLFGLFWVCGV